MRSIRSGAKFWPFRRRMIWHRTPRTVRPGPSTRGRGVSPLEHQPPIDDDPTDLVGTPRDNLSSFLSDIAQLEALFGTWDSTTRAAVEAYRRAIEAINGEALRRLVRALK